jgi:CheY-like chemotaxis protein
MNSTPKTVLLAGDPTTQSATLRKWSGHLDYRWEFAASFQDACRLMSQREFDLVLCQYELPDRTAFPLLDWLEGSRSTLLFSAPAGRGSKWLPMIEHGRRCLDRPLLRTKELPNALGNLLDGHAGSDSRGSGASTRELQQVGTR